jgi:hypothetical protein
LRWISTGEASIARADVVVRQDHRELPEHLVAAGRDLRGGALIRELDRFVALTFPICATIPGAMSRTARSMTRIASGPTKKPMLPPGHVSA